MTKDARGERILARAARHRTSIVAERAAVFADASISVLLFLPSSASPFTVADREVVQSEAEAIPSAEHTFHAASAQRAA